MLAYTSSPPTQWSCPAGCWLCGRGWAGPVSQSVRGSGGKVSIIFTWSGRLVRLPTYDTHITLHSTLPAGPVRTSDQFLNTPALSQTEAFLTTAGRREERVSKMVRGRWEKMVPSVLLLILHSVFLCKKSPMFSTFSNQTLSSGREFRVLQLLCPAASKISQLSTARVRASLLPIRWFWRLCGELHPVNLLHDSNLQTSSEKG